MATAAAVYQDTPAIVRGVSGPYAVEIEVTILDVLADNFGSDAADDLPDSWQVRYFGADAAKAGKYDDFDNDGVGNLIEFASGTDPANGKRQPLRFESGALAAPGMPLFDYSITTNALPYRALFVRRKNSGVHYNPQFRADLANWYNAATPVEVLAEDDAFELVSVRFPVFIAGRRSSSKFFRLNLTTNHK